MTYTELEQKLLDTGLVNQSEYLTKYCKLLIDNRLTEYNSTIANYHHAIPRLYYEEKKLELDNSSNNLFILLYKDHVLAHYYLAMAAKNNDFKYKMAYAVRFVIGQISDEAEKLLLDKLPEVQKSYEMIAQDFSANNPSKNPKNAKKISEARRGKIYVRKDGKSIVISPEDLDKYLADGWERGRVGKWSHDQKGKIGIIFNGTNRLISKDELQTYLDLGAIIGQLPHTIKNKGKMGQLSKETREKIAANRRGKIAIRHKITGQILYINKEDYKQYEQDYLLGSGIISRGVINKV